MKNGNFFVLFHYSRSIPFYNLGNTPLHWAAKYGHFDVCVLISKKMMYQNPLNKENKTPKDLAMENQNVEDLGQREKYDRIVLFLSL